MGCTPIVRQKVKTLPRPIEKIVAIDWTIDDNQPVGEAEASSAGEQLAKE